MERDLSGRCGTCAFFVPYRVEGVEVTSGDCRVWKAKRLETATCSSYKAIGGAWDEWKKKKPAAAGTPRKMREQDHDDEPVAPPLPREIDIDMDQDEFRRVLRQVLREELGVSHTVMAERFRGGELVIKPGKKETAEKSLPLDSFFHKIVMLRDRLRVLEQKINGSDKLADDEKVAMQQYVTACYGTLTTFNVLFRDDEDKFEGQKSKE